MTPNLSRNNPQPVAAEQKSFASWSERAASWHSQDHPTNARLRRTDEPPAPRA
jgi:hypothetical protein